MISFVTSSFEQTLRFEGKVLNGNLVAFIILQMLIVHIPLLVALVTGDLISGEAAMGTLRMLVSRPISRSQLLLSKFLAGGIYTLLIVCWLGILAVIVGRFLFGPGDLMVLNSDGLIILQEQDVMWRYAGGFCVAFLALLTISSLSICLSCFRIIQLGRSFPRWRLFCYSRLLERWMYQFLIRSDLFYSRPTWRHGVHFLRTHCLGSKLSNRFIC